MFFICCCDAIVLYSLSIVMQSYNATQSDTQENIVGLSVLLMMMVVD
jgi:hypothetical protein